MRKYLRALATFVVVVLLPHAALAVETTPASSSSISPDAPLLYWAVGSLFVAAICLGIVACLAPMLVLSMALSLMTLVPVPAMAQRHTPAAPSAPRTPTSTRQRVVLRLPLVDIIRAAAKTGESFARGDATCYLHHLDTPQGSLDEVTSVVSDEPLRVTRARLPFRYGWQGRIVPGTYDIQLRDQPYTVTVAPIGAPPRDYTVTMTPRDADAPALTTTVRRIVELSASTAPHITWNQITYAVTYWATRHQDQQIEYVGFIWPVTGGYRTAWVDITPRQPGKLFHKRVRVAGDDVLHVTIEGDGTLVIASPPPPAPPRLERDDPFKRKRRDTKVQQAQDTRSQPPASPQDKTLGSDPALLMVGLALAGRARSAPRAPRGPSDHAITELREALQRVEGTREATTTSLFTRLLRSLEAPPRSTADQIARTLARILSDAPREDAWDVIERAIMLIPAVDHIENFTEPLQRWVTQRSQAFHGGRVSWRATFNAETVVARPPSRWRDGQRIIATPHLRFWLHQLREQRGLPALATLARRADISIHALRGLFANPTRRPSAMDAADLRALFDVLGHRVGPEASLITRAHTPAVTADEARRHLGRLLQFGRGGLIAPDLDRFDRTQRLLDVEYLLEQLPRDERSAWLSQLRAMRRHILNMTEGIGGGVTLRRVLDRLVPEAATRRRAGRHLVLALISAGAWLAASSAHAEQLAGTGQHIAWPTGWLIALSLLVVIGVARSVLPRARDALATLARRLRSPPRAAPSEVAPEPAQDVERLLVWGNPRDRQRIVETMQALLRESPEAQWHAFGADFDGLSLLGDLAGPMLLDQKLGRMLRAVQRWGRKRNWLSVRFDERADELIVLVPQAPDDAALGNLRRAFANIAGTRRRSGTLLVEARHAQRPFSDQERRALEAIPAVRGVSAYTDATGQRLRMFVRSELRDAPLDVMDRVTRQWAQQSGVSFHAIETVLIAPAGESPYFGLSNHDSGHHVPVTTAIRSLEAAPNPDDPLAVERFLRASIYGVLEDVRRGKGLRAPLSLTPGARGPLEEELPDRPDMPTITEGALAAHLARGEAVEIALSYGGERHRFDILRWAASWVFHRRRKGVIVIHGVAQTAEFIAFAGRTLSDLIARDSTSHDHWRRLGDHFVRLAGAEEDLATLSRDVDVLRRRWEQRLNAYLKSARSPVRVRTRLLVERRGSQDESRESVEERLRAGREYLVKFLPAGAVLWLDDMSPALSAQLEMARSVRAWMGLATSELQNGGSTRPPVAVRQFLRRLSRSPIPSALGPVTAATIIGAMALVWSLSGLGWLGLGVLTWMTVRLTLTAWRLSAPGIGNQRLSLQLLWHPLTWLDAVSKVPLVVLPASQRLWQPINDYVPPREQAWLSLFQRIYQALARRSPLQRATAAVAVASLIACIPFGWHLARGLWRRRARVTKPWHPEPPAAGPRSDTSAARKRHEPPRAKRQPGAPSTATARVERTRRMNGAEARITGRVVRAIARSVGETEEAVRGALQDVERRFLNAAHMPPDVDMAQDSRQLAQLVREIDRIHDLGTQPRLSRDRMWRAVWARSPIMALRLMARETPPVEEAQDKLRYVVLLADVLWSELDEAPEIPERITATIIIDTTAQQCAYVVEAAYERAQPQPWAIEQIVASYPRTVDGQTMEVPGPFVTLKPYPEGSQRTTLLLRHLVGEIRRHVARRTSRHQHIDERAAFERLAGRVQKALALARAQQTADAPPPTLEEVARVLQEPPDSLSMQLYDMDTWAREAARHRGHRTPAMDKVLGWRNRQKASGTRSRQRRLRGLGRGSDGLTEASFGRLPVTQAPIITLDDEVDAAAGQRRGMRGAVMGRRSAMAGTASNWRQQALERFGDTLLVRSLLDPMEQAAAHAEGSFATPLSWVAAHTLTSPSTVRLSTIMRALVQHYYPGFKLHIRHAVGEDTTFPLGRSEHVQLARAFAQRQDELTWRHVGWLDRMQVTLQLTFDEWKGIVRAIGAGELLAPTETYETFFAQTLQFLSGAGPRMPQATLWERIVTAAPITQDQQDALRAARPMVLRELPVISLEQLGQALRYVHARGLSTSRRADISRAQWYRDRALPSPAAPLLAIARAVHGQGVTTRKQLRALMIHLVMAEAQGDVAMVARRFGVQPLTVTRWLLQYGVQAEEYVGAAALAQHRGLRMDVMVGLPCILLFVTGSMIGFYIALAGLLVAVARVAWRRHQRYQAAHRAADAAQLQHLRDSITAQLEPLEELETWLARQRSPQRAAAAAQREMSAIQSALAQMRDRAFAGAQSLRPDDRAGWDRQIEALEQRFRHLQPQIAQAGARYKALRQQQEKRRQAERMTQLDALTQRVEGALTAHRASLRYAERRPALDGAFAALRALREQAPKDRRLPDLQRRFEREWWVMEQCKQLLKELDVPDVVMAQRVLASLRERAPEHPALPVAERAIVERQQALARDEVRQALQRAPPLDESISDAAERAQRMALWEGLLQRSHEVGLPIEESLAVRDRLAHLLRVHRRWQTALSLARDGVERSQTRRQELASVEPSQETRRILDVIDAVAPRLWVTRIVAALALGRRQEADASSRHAMAIYPTDGHLIALRIKVLTNEPALPQVDAAIAVGESAIQRLPEDDGLRVILADVHQMLAEMNPARAPASYQRILELLQPILPRRDRLGTKPREELNLHYLTALLALNDETLLNEAAQYARLLVQAEHLSRKSAKATAAVAQALDQAGRAHDALRIAEPLTESHRYLIDPWITCVSAHLRLGKASQDARDDRQALHAFQQALTVATRGLSEARPYVSYHLGKRADIDVREVVSADDVRAILRRVSKRSDTIRAADRHMLERALMSHLTQLRMLHVLSLAALLQLQAWARAIAYADHVLAMYPNDHDVQRMRGQAAANASPASSSSPPNATARGTLRNRWQTGGPRSRRDPNASRRAPRGATNVQRGRHSMLRAPLLTRVLSVGGTIALCGALWFGARDMAQRARVADGTAQPVTFEQTEPTRAPSLVSEAAPSPAPAPQPRVTPIIDHPAPRAPPPIHPNILSVRPPLPGERWPLPRLTPSQTPAPSPSPTPRPHRAPRGPHEDLGPPRRSSAPRPQGRPNRTSRNSGSGDNPTAVQPRGRQRSAMALDEGQREAKARGINPSLVLPGLHLDTVGQVERHPRAKEWFRRNQGYAVDQFYRGVAVMLRASRRGRPRVMRPEYRILFVGNAPPWYHVHEILHDVGAHLPEAWQRRFVARMLHTATQVHQRISQANSVFSEHLMRRMVTGIRRSHDPLRTMETYVDITEIIAILGGAHLRAISPAYRDWGLHEDIFVPLFEELPLRDPEAGSGSTAWLAAAGAVLVMIGIALVGLSLPGSHREYLVPLVAYAALATVVAGVWGGTRMTAFRSAIAEGRDREAQYLRTPWLNDAQAVVDELRAARVATVDVEAMEQEVQRERQVVQWATAFTEALAVSPPNRGQAVTLLQNIAGHAPNHPVLPVLQRVLSPHRTQATSRAQVDDDVVRRELRTLADALYKEFEIATDAMVARCEDVLARSIEARIPVEDTLRLRRKYFLRLKDRQQWEPALRLLRQSARLVAARQAELSTHEVAGRVAHILWELDAFERVVHSEWAITALKAGRLEEADDVSKLALEKLFTRRQKPSRKPQASLAPSERFDGRLVAVRLGVLGAMGEQQRPPHPAWDAAIRIGEQHIAQLPDDPGLAVKLASIYLNRAGSSHRSLKERGDDREQALILLRNARAADATLLTGPLKVDLDASLLLALLQSDDPAALDEAARYAWRTVADATALHPKVAKFVYAVTLRLWQADEVRHAARIIERLQVIAPEALRDWNARLHRERAGAGPRGRPGRGGVSHRRRWQGGGHWTPPPRRLQLERPTTLVERGA